MHPVAAITKSLQLIRSNIVTIVVILVLGGRGEDAFMLPFLGASFLLLLVSGVLDWWRFTYQVLPGELHVRKGVLVRKELMLPRQRIQVVEIREGFLERLFGLVRLEVQTASVNERLTLSSITKQEARRINELLTGVDSEPSRELVPGDAEAVSAAPDAPPPMLRFRLPSKELFLAAATSGGFGVTLSVLGTLYTQVQAVVGDSVIFDWIEATLPGLAGGAWGVIFILFLLISWTLSFTGYLLANGRFEVERTPEEIIIRRGLFERNRTTLPLKRIQAARVIQGVLRQPLGRAGVIVESAGFGDDQGSGSSTLIPLLPAAQVPELMNRLLPRLTFIDPTTRPPSTARHRYVLRTLLLPIFTAVLAISLTLPGLLEDVRRERLLEHGEIAPEWIPTDPKQNASHADVLQAPVMDGQFTAPGGLAHLTDHLKTLRYAFETRSAPWWGTSALLVWMGMFLLLGLARHRAAGIGVVGQALSVRNRRFALETTHLNRSNIQSLSLSQTWVQRRSDVCTLSLRIASGRTGRTVRIRDLRREEAQRVQGWYKGG